MSKKIKVTAYPSEVSKKTFTMSVSDLGFSDEEWDLADTDTREKAIRAELDSNPEQPYWELNHWEDNL